MTLASAPMRSWAARALVAGLVLFLVGQRNSLRRAEAALSDMQNRAAELQAAVDAGLVVAKAAQDVASRVPTLEAQNADLKKALEHAWAALPAAQPVSTLHASTGPVVAHGAPRPETNAGHLASPGAVPPPTAPAAEPGSPPPGEREAGGTSPPCLLADGDQGEVRVDTVTLEAKAGTRVVVGAASAWRVAPGPPARLFGGPFDVALTEAVEKAPPAKEPGRWGAGPLVGVGMHGSLAGALLVTPEGRLPLLGWRVSAAVVGAAGTGEGLVLGGVVVRP